MHSSSSSISSNSSSSSSIWFPSKTERLTATEEADIEAAIVRMDAMNSLCTAPTMLASKLLDCPSSQSVQPSDPVAQDNSQPSLSSEPHNDEATSSTLVSPTEIPATPTIARGISRVRELRLQKQLELKTAADDIRDQPFQVYKDFVPVCFIYPVQPVPIGSLLVDSQDFDPLQLYPCTTPTQLPCLLPRNSPYLPTDMTSWYYVPRPPRYSLPIPPSDSSSSSGSVNAEIADSYENDRAFSASDSDDSFFVQSPMATILPSTSAKMSDPIFPTSASLPASFESAPSHLNETLPRRATLCGPPPSFPSSASLSSLADVADTSYDSDSPQPYISPLPYPARSVPTPRETNQPPYPYPSQPQRRPRKYYPAGPVSPAFPLPPVPQSPPKRVRFLLVELPPVVRPPTPEHTPEEPEEQGPIGVIKTVYRFFKGIVDRWFRLKDWLEAQ